jgi:hypothetical protein
MRTLSLRAEIAMLLWTVAFGGAAAYVPSTSFLLGIPLGIDVALDRNLHLLALGTTSGCNHPSSTLKRYESLVERPGDLVAMVETTNVSTNRSEGKSEDADSTAKESDRKSQDAPAMSQEKVYLGGDQPDGCPEDIDTLHCDECGGNKGSLDGMSRCKGVSVNSIPYESLPS